ncbi:TonB-dependent siderophore receptor [Piscinibacter defluvii]|uniref:TonB-dependent siderophore receptor n=1 Tax=Piscinibacter defluvii TaxID=1796922 RepID=UPI000FDDA047|nr:TonB-dependent siderophore receptor [Piscinibacter defluvii]
MATPRRHFRPRRLVLACLAGCSTAGAFAQAQLDPVTITGRVTPTINAAGWGEVPLAKLPLQAGVFTAERLLDRGATRLSDLTNFDPAVSDAYNAEGYWDQLTVRGYVIDNRFNYRRDGLPINAETSIPLDNKAQVEVLKGISGMQAGTSAPGGLVNLVVKRPLDTPLRRAAVDWREKSTLTGAVDLSDRFGAERAFGVRLNAAAAHLDPLVRDSRGSRQMLAVAGDWRLGAGTLLEAEVESSHRSQPSQAAFSMWGDRVPAPVDPRRNLNDQRWSLPVVLDGDTASLRWRQTLSADWSFIAHAATQRLRSDDRIAFPFGCSAADGTYYPDRYCPDGSFDLYDFRSENERRRTDALDLSLTGRVQVGSWAHALTLGVLNSRVKNRFQRQAFNYVGTVGPGDETPADPTLTDENTQRDEHTSEVYARDAIAIDARWTAWLGVRHTRLHRQSVRTDGSRPTDYRQTFTTPFVALSYAYVPDQLVYASWGRGMESSVAPNRTRYTNAGEASTQTSRQAELGLKGSTESLEWSAALFDVVKHIAADIGSCDDPGTCTYQPDGTQRHLGGEGSISWRTGAWTWLAGAQWLRARREGSANAGVNGNMPYNVPARTLKLQAEHRLAAVPGLVIEGSGRYTSRRYVDPLNSASIPGYAVLGVAARQAVRFGAQTLTWRAGVDNLTDKRAWRESPFQFGHVYLYPLRPRTAWLGVQVDL